MQVPLKWTQYPCFIIWYHTKWCHTPSNCCSGIQIPWIVVWCSRAGHKEQRATAWGHLSITDKFMSYLRAGMEWISKYSWCQGTVVYPVVYPNVPNPICAPTKSLTFSISHPTLVGVSNQRSSCASFLCVTVLAKESYVGHHSCCFSLDPQKALTSGWAVISQQVRTHPAEFRDVQSSLPPR